jgi:hypothetical protein
MTYRTPRETTHPLLWAALAALSSLLLVIAYLIWSMWHNFA